jgi:hypothetical protein
MADMLASVSMVSAMEAWDIARARVSSLAARRVSKSASLVTT